MDYSEIIMQSMDVLVAKRLSELQFDKTINAKIVSNVNAQFGEYEITDGATTFTAYSKDVTLKVDDNVYVTIPNGNYDNQKQIIGKYVGEGESLTYLSPLESYVDITGDLCNFTSGASLLANRVYDKNSDGPINLVSQKTIWSANIQNGKCFERLSIQADFKTWLKKLKINSGNFGLCLYVTYVDKSTVNTQDSEKVKAYILDSDSMCGNPYNFESFYTQQKTFDISDITGQITNMKLVFYQDYNFGTTSGEPAATKDANENWLVDNIYVNNIHINMGYDIEKFDKDTILLYTTNEQTYNRNYPTQNHKVLQTRWVRFTNEGIYSIDAADEIPENAAIHWYKYQIKMQEDVDELAGPFWFEIPEGLNKLQIEVDPDVDEISQLYKVVAEVPSKQWIENQLDPDLNAEYKDLLFESTRPDLSEEEYLSISNELNIYESNIQSQRIIVESEPIEFKSEVPVIDKMTADLINGLQIEIDDDYKGNYLLYNSSNQIQSTRYSTQLRTMRATYKSLVTGEQTLDGAEEIIWKIPLTNTMIYPPEDGKEFDGTKDKSLSYWIQDGYMYIKRMSGNANSGTLGTINDWTAEQKFRIKDYFQETATNNTVYCYVVKNNIAYEASTQMIFGQSGNSGTDFTFKMQFESDNVGFIKDSSDILKVKILMFDFYNDEVPHFWDNGVTVTWYSSDNQNSIFFCDENGEVNSNSFLTFYDTNNNVIKDNKNFAKKLVVKDQYFYIKYNGSKVPNFYTIQAVVNADPTAKGTAVQLNQIRLTCELPVPWRSDKKYIGFDGAVKILYNNNGTSPSCCMQSYQLWQIENEKTSVVDGINWGIVVPAAESDGDQYYPRMSVGNKLILPSMYINNLSKQICVQAVKDGEILWTQPIIIKQDVNSSALLNAWDGNLTIDEKNGTILSTMMGAGFKDNQNRFNGVLMGDVKDTLDSASIVGLYGFNEGVQSFGWKVDGTGFVGKSGQGQIIFNGNRGTISSGIWTNSGKKIGMEIDLDGETAGDNWNSTGSSLKMYGAAGRVDVNTSETSTELFRIQGRKQDNLNTKDPSNFQYQDMIKISLDVDKGYKTSGTDEVSMDTSFYIQSLGYSAGSIGTRLDLQNGYFYSFGKYGRIQFTTGDSTFFRLADKDNKVLFVIKSTEAGDGATGKDASAGLSSYYLQSSNFNSSTATGTRLDLQKGKYSSFGKNGRIEIAPDETTFFRIADKDNNVLFILKAGTDTDGENLSSYYLQSSNFSSTSKSGNRLDLQNGKFTTYGSKGYVIIDSGNSNLFRIYGKNDKLEDKALMVVGNSGYYLQTLDFNTTNKTGTQIDLKNGRITSYKFSISAKNTAEDINGNISMSSESSSIPFEISGSSGEFSVSWNGTVTCTNLIATNTGTIGPFNINSSCLYTGDSSWAKAGIYLGTSGFSINSGNFRIDSNGNTVIGGSLTVKGAATLNSTFTVSSGGSVTGGNYSFNESGGYIGPWNIDESGIYTEGRQSELGTSGTIKLSNGNGSFEVDKNATTVKYGNKNYFSIASSYTSAYCGGGRLYLTDTSCEISAGAALASVTKGLEAKLTYNGTSGFFVDSKGVHLMFSASNSLTFTESEILIDGQICKQDKTVNIRSIFSDNVQLKFHKGLLIEDNSSSGGSSGGSTSEPIKFSDDLKVSGHISAYPPSSSTLTALGKLAFKDKVEVTGNFSLGGSDLTASRQSNSGDTATYLVTIPNKTQSGTQDVRMYNYYCEETGEGYCSTVQKDYYQMDDSGYIYKYVGYNSVRIPVSLPSGSSTLTAKITVTAT